MPLTIFSRQQLDALAAEALHNNPAIGDHDNALVGTVDNKGAQVVVAFSKDTERGRWTATAAGRHEWTGENSAGASVIYSWKKT